MVLSVGSSSSICISSTTFARRSSPSHLIATFFLTATRPNISIRVDTMGSSDFSASLNMLSRLLIFSSRAAGEMLTDGDVIASWVKVGVRRWIISGDDGGVLTLPPFSSQAISLSSTS